MHCSADLDGDEDVDRNDLMALMMLIRSGNADLTLHDFNQDGMLSTADILAMMALCTRAGCAAE